jgi:hypothetical protein
MTAPDENVGPEDLPGCVAAEPAPTNVIAALACVQKDIGGIEKLSQAERARRGMSVAEQGGVKWPYRGIDQITQAAQPLFGRYGVVIVPHKIQRHVVDDIVVRDNPWTDTTVEVKWRIYGPGGYDDRITAETIGVGRDNSDKGYNKAMTGAYKNLLLRILSIGDPKDDTDQQSHAIDGQTGPAPKDERVVEAFAGLKHLDDDQQAEIKSIAERLGKKLSEQAFANDVDWLAVVESFLDGSYVPPEAELEQMLESDPPGEVEAGGGHTDPNLPPEQPSPTTDLKSADTEVSRVADEKRAVVEEQLAAMAHGPEEPDD